MALTRRAALARLGAGLAGGLGWSLTGPRSAAQRLDATPNSANSAPLELTAARLTQGGWTRGQTLPGGEVWLDGQELAADSRGGFLLAFDRDAGPSTQLQLRRGGQVIASRSLAIAPRAWQIEHVNAPLRPPGVPEAEFQRRRAAELARIAAARALETGAQGWRQDMIRPAQGRISGRFGAQRVYRGQPGAYHSGLDFAAAAGAPILAPADGVVILAAQEPFTLEGRLLLLDHGMGLSSAFLHCSAHAVAEGEPVRQGQPIASVGMTGRATGPHLHWGLRWHTARLDPLLFLPEGR